MNRTQPLDPGDVICDQCNGTGEPGDNKIDPNDKLLMAPWYCDKCNGTGKLDWIENVTGKKKPILFTSKWDISKSYFSDEYNSFNDKIYADASKAMVVAIDKQIIESITGECNGNKT